MECNRDEAVRAKELAERKMSNKDFVGARKMIIRAQKLYPSLENSGQMLTICEVHCSPLHGAEHDWYSVLQIQQTADDVLIKKQYKKLALQLHPDKNKFPGAEAAFKLISDANMILGDQSKRQAFDRRRNVVRPGQLNPPQAQPIRNNSVNNQPRMYSNPESTSMNPPPQQNHHQTEPIVGNGQQTCWTACPFCKSRWLSYRDKMPTAIYCQNCMNPFVAYELNNWSFPQEKEGSSQNGQKMPQENVQRNHCNKAPVSSPPTKRGRASVVGGAPKNKAKDGTERKGTSTERKASGTKNRKRGRNPELEKDGVQKDGNAENGKKNADEVTPDDKSNEGPEKVVVEVPDPDFYDFDKDRSEECFAKDQMWATFDEFDSMPRYYARIKKVHSPFKVDITWLDVAGGNSDVTAWRKSGLPVACGKFKHEKADTIEHISMFSHRVVWEKGSRNSFMIYPRKGETWAIFKNWNIKWNSDPDNHREYECEVVEVLSEYTQESGILVAPLVKIKGFVCLFKPAKTDGMGSFQIPSNEVLRFSHRVPSFKTNGKEREDVPEGYFELDPASMPSNLEEVSDKKAETVDGKTNGSLKSELKEKLHTPKKRKSYDEKSTLNGSSTGRVTRSSSRLSNGH